MGGWTDTWYAGSGAVCHLAVGPGVSVSVEPSEGVTVSAPDVGARYSFEVTTPPGRHPLLEQAVLAALPAGAAGALVSVSSAVPPGASLGTSAAVVVGIVEAVGTAYGISRDAAEVAALAHEVEVRRLGRESGVQDQWAAATGGAGLLRVDPYPQVARTPVPLSAETVATLDDSLVTVFVGAHDSSDVHRAVIAAIRPDGRVRAEASRALHDLSVLAAVAADALRMGDLERWAGILTSATETQARLHPELVGPRHHELIALARRTGARGWKVNGAGGSGGSLTVLLPDPEAAAAFAHGAASVGRVLDLTPAQARA